MPPETFVARGPSMPGLTSTQQQLMNSGRFRASADAFLQPCSAMKVSGGTAAFFNVRYKDGQEPCGVDPDFYLGKDLAHATDEFEFYEKLGAARASDAKWRAFSKVAMECPGVATMQVTLGGEQQETRELLLLENMRTGFEKLRLLDIKLGDQTSVAGWKGKSAAHAWKNQMVDRCTNSQREGFRLEGMDCPPKILQERNTAIIKGRTSLRGLYNVNDKKSWRILLQQLRAYEMIALWVDMFEFGERAEVHSHAALWSSVDAMDLVVKALLDLPVPQQWIGSSLALGLEASSVRDHPKVIAKVFDWGRAELMTAEEYDALQENDQKQRIHFWRQYCKAVVRFQWELLRLVTHRCCCKVWTAFVIELESKQASVIRSALFGFGAGNCGVGATMYQLQGSHVSERGKDLVLPLLGRHRVDKNPVGLLKGMLYINIREHIEDNGHQFVAISVRGVSDTKVELVKEDETAVTTLRIIAFEHARDARAHLEAWHSGATEVEPTPVGRAYELRTRPGVWNGKTLMWGREEDRFEFLGLGPLDAGEAQDRLADSLPQAAKGLRRSSRSTGDLKWQPMMVPTVGRDVEEAGAPPQILDFWRSTAAWLDEGASIPERWTVRGSRNT